MHRLCVAFFLGVCLVLTEYKSCDNKSMHKTIKSAFIIAIIFVAYFLMKNKNIPKSTQPIPNYIEYHTIKNTNLIRKINTKNEIKKISVPKANIVEEKMAKQEAEKPDDNQFEKIEKIKQQMTAASQSWQLVRDQAYVSMGLQDSEIEYLAAARDQMGLEFDDFAIKLNSTDDSEHTNLVKSLQGINLNYDVFVQKTLGHNRYKLISSVRNKFNEAIKSQDESSVQISNDW